MVKMKKMFMITTLLLISSVTFAQQDYPLDIQLSWNWPTHYELVPGDSVAAEIQPGDLTAARLTCSRHNGEEAFNTVIPIATGVLPGQRQTQVFTGDIPKPGSYTCLAFARVEYTTAVNTTAFLESRASNATVKRFVGKPGPNENLAAQ